MRSSDEGARFVQTARAGGRGVGRSICGRLTEAGAQRPVLPHDSTLREWLSGLGERGPWVVGGLVTPKGTEEPQRESLSVNLEEARAWRRLPACLLGARLPGPGVSRDTAGASCPAGLCCSVPGPGQEGPLCPLQLCASEALRAGRLGRCSEASENKTLIHLFLCKCDVNLSNAF